ncbi:alpha/beta fold hydrolase [Enemella sp. A6]|uniref:alpha/beta fold hydrolase n=1 Tax=Enemella sp. A6 TaxID=3440152 RepID=UPI003EC0A008
MPHPGVLDPADLRYERYFPPVPLGMPRAAQSWAWGQHRVHLEHVGEADAPVRIILVHGAGGNAAAMWPLAAQFAALGARITMPDLPGYGRTQSRQPGRIRFHQWGDMLADLVTKEDDERPLLLIGASLGGLLALDTATRTGAVDAVIATALLDPSDPDVRAATLRSKWLATAGPALLAAAAGPFASRQVPLRWVSRMGRIANEPELRKELLHDTRGAGNTASLGWMRSFLKARPHTPAEQVDVPVVLVHGDRDRWTPLALSVKYLRRIPAPTAVVPLVDSGHFPSDEAGVATMINSVAMVIDALATAPADQRKDAVAQAVGALDEADSSPEGIKPVQPRWEAARVRSLKQTLRHPHDEYARWLYRGGPRTITKLLYLKPASWLSRTRLSPMVNLVVDGRRSGKPVSFPLVMAKLDGQRYLVSMLGERAQWVHNVRAAEGAATLRHGRTEHVQLVELGPDRVQRARVMQAFLKSAPGARPHIPVQHDDPLEVIGEVAADWPIFRVETAQTSIGR